MWRLKIDEWWCFGRFSLVSRENHIALDTMAGLHQLHIHVFELQ